MKKELLLACGLMLALPGVQGFAAEKTDEWSALNYHKESKNYYYESEPNDTLSKATNIQIDSTIEGRTDNEPSYEDFDYFKFSISEKNMTYSLYAENDGRELTKALKVRVLSEDGKEVAKSTIYNEEKWDAYQYIEANLLPGTYYIEVTNSYPRDIYLPYAFRHLTSPKQEPSIERIAGESRYETAVEISRTGWEFSDVAVIATGKNYPDALSATPLAYSNEAPLLLTNPAELPDLVIEELKRLGVKEVYLVGGTSAISDNVKTQLSKMNIKVNRISGANRYETSVNIAKEIGTEGSVVLATGKNFADALSIAPIAAQLNMPILLTEKENVPKEVSNYIRDWKANKAFVIGGKEVITDSALKNIPGKERISGSDRYETNSNVIKRFQSDIDPTETFIATGKNFPDALSGSALASLNMSPVVLTNPKTANTYTKNIINELSGATSYYYILGGETTLPQNAIDQLFE
ncbi:cell wall-binding repeat-containing protein [Metabacillus indicus]|uniref:cell wall-binding repeat-containing protein n=1 Tax=Metabacillus indicus TaxID=246786 RepID=UPI00068BDC27|nr:cell wall-binding repeat-containing protein [Metabacillus indicus]